MSDSTFVGNAGTTTGAILVDLGSTANIAVILCPAKLCCIIMTCCPCTFVDVALAYAYLMPGPVAAFKLQFVALSGCCTQIAAGVRAEVSTCKHGQSNTSQVTMHCHSSRTVWTVQNMFKHRGDHSMSCHESRDARGHQNQNPFTLPAVRSTATHALPHT